MLAKEGIDPTVVDMKFVKPLDVELLKKMCTNHRILLTVEENAIEGGFGSRVAEFIATLEEPPRVIRLGIPDRFIEHGTRRQLLKNMGLTAEGIVSSIRKAVSTVKNKVSN
jgi:1-deoxy-D-xylulose-5-phosphate synthase